MKENKIKEGDRFKTNQGCECVVLEYNSAFDVRVMFLDNYKHIKRVSAGDLRNGEVGNPFFPTTYGRGFMGADKNDEGAFKTSHKAYMYWKGAMERCYNEQSLQRSPTYLGCEVAEVWYNYQIFASWAESQVGFNNKGWQLDKDFLSVGQRGTLYCPEICIFLPQELNTFFIIPSTKTDDLPVGVSYCKDRGNYQVGVGGGGFRKALGRYKTPEEAYEVYLKHKRERALDLAMKYQGHVDQRVIEKLLTL